LLPLHEQLKQNIKRGKNMERLARKTIKHLFK
jgi:hypothetical protein